MLQYQFLAICEKKTAFNRPSKNPSFTCSRMGLFSGNSLNSFQLPSGGRREDLYNTIGIKWFGILRGLHTTKKFSTSTLPSLSFVEEKATPVKEVPLSISSGNRSLPLAFLGRRLMAADRQPTGGVETPPYVKRFVNHLMVDGKKGVAISLFADSLRFFLKRLQEEKGGHLPAISPNPTPPGAGGKLPTRSNSLPSKWPFLFLRRLEGDSQESGNTALTHLLNPSSIPISLTHLLNPSKMGYRVTGLQGHRVTKGILDIHQDLSAAYFPGSWIYLYSRQSSGCQGTLSECKNKKSNPCIGSMLIPRYGEGGSLLSKEARPRFLRRKSLIEFFKPSSNLEKGFLLLQIPGTSLLGLPFSSPVRVDSKHGISLVGGKGGDSMYQPLPSLGPEMENTDKCSSEMIEPHVSTVLHSSSPARQEPSFSLPLGGRQESVTSGSIPTTSKGSGGQRAIDHPGVGKSNASISELDGTPAHTPVALKPLIGKQVSKREPSPSLSLLRCLEFALRNVEPSLEVRKKKIAGITRQIPCILPKSRGEGLAIRWLVSSAQERRRKEGKGLSECLAEELTSAYYKRGEPRQKRDSLHKLAEGNRSFLRYRWW